MITLIQSIIKVTGLCDFDKDGNLRWRNKIGAVSWGLISKGTDCMCCVGIRVLLLATLVPLAYGAGYLLGH